MLTGELRNKVDSLWEIFWTGGLANPLDVIEQMTYLMFIHDLDANDNLRAKEAAMLGLPHKSMFAGEVQIGDRKVDGQQLKWSVFHDFDAGRMYSVVQELVFPFIKNLGGKDSGYSKYMADAIFKVPTPLMLSKIVDAMDSVYEIMEKNPKDDTKGDLYEYLLNKISQSGINGQFRTPRHIIKMMVELMQPKPDFTICDPACGTAGFLVASEEYLMANHKKEIFFDRRKKDHFLNHMFFGYDMDRTMLRIGAMNMMTHGVDSPFIEYRDSLSDQNPDKEKFDLILANPPFKGSLDADTVSADLLKVCKTKKSELLFLALFLRMLKTGGRCACIVPDGVLFGSSTAHKAIRKELVEGNRLEAVISMPSGVFKPYADYVLYDDAHKPLAVIEAKRTCVDVSKGRQQAELYADILEKKYGRRPAVFLTNGFETHILDGQYPERKCATIYSKRDLTKMFNLRTMRTSLKNVIVKKNIAGRYYQEGAIKAVCDAFDKKNRRKALLVMATGSGKTRTVIALCDVLLNHGWVKNILFLADRNSLVTQAKRSFVNLLPDLSVTNLCEEKDNYTAHCVFSTYQTMMNCIDNVKDEQGKLFTCGHFDLVICDEAHRSIYNKYRDIFNYFDAPLVGLTATPKDEIDKNTYEVFELESGVPTYGYELAQAVKDGYLVDFMSVETKLKFLDSGITYEDLPEDEREEYENTFTDENGELPEKIVSSALNEWVFNEDTIRQVLHVLMTEGIKIDYGQKLGKTIIFAKNHAHAEKIYEIFNKEYPHLPGFAKVIDNRINYAQSLIDQFSDPKKLPQIAISVDMLDTGIDVPECLNLVFFKKVMSKAKFWQMIGRGTRLCPGLKDGEDKDKFYIFDFCGNFEFFRMSNGKPTALQIALQGAIFSLKAQIVFKLQDLAYQIPELIAFRKTLVDDMVRKVQELNKDNFAVRQHLKFVELFSNPDHYTTLTYENTLQMRDELAPLITPDADDAKAVRFDALMYGIELA